MYKQRDFLCLKKVIHRNVTKMEFKQPTKTHNSERIIKLIYEKGPNGTLRREVFIKNYQGWIVIAMGILTALVIFGIFFLKAA